MKTYTRYSLALLSVLVVERAGSMVCATNNEGKGFMGNFIADTGAGWSD
jgi:hypothetical protein